MKKLVPAIRCILASRSSVMDRMLYGNFSEASDSTIKIPYTTKVLQNLVSYIYTDTAPTLKEVDVCKQPYAFILQIAALVDAALYFELSALAQKALSILNSVTANGDTLAALNVLNACGAFASLSYTSTAEVAMKKSLLETRFLEKEEVVKGLSSNTIKIILENQNISVNEISLFRILYAWSKTTDQAEAEGCRQQQATKFTSLIALTKIDPNDLDTVVAKSQLVSASQLFEAYKTQAKFAVEKRGVLYSFFSWSGLETLRGHI